MKDHLAVLKSGIAQGIKNLYGHSVEESDLVLSVTRKEFIGDYTLVVFTLTKVLRKKPEDIANEVGEWMKNNLSELITDYNVIKGFLNFSLNPNFWTQVLKDLTTIEGHAIEQKSNSTVLVEFSSPNTNKPLHLGHIRNIVLGWSTAKILDWDLKRSLKIL